VARNIKLIEDHGSAAEPLYRKPTQARGIAKFEQILDAGHKLIEEQPTQEISLYDVASEAGVATGSVYHFFPNIESVFVALVERYDERFANIIRETAIDNGLTSWQDLLVRHTENSRAFINAHPPALLLLIGPLRSWQSKQVDTVGDTRIAHAMTESYGQLLTLPPQPKHEIILHHAIRILEGLWELSYQQHGYVTDDMSRETNRAMTAYLSLYWPRYLPLK
jgi:AcrR family transcriptional regulator